ncbi:MAG: hypothetical protein P1U34_12240 [Coxiellaceae bacterium]|nr:hypothetical protein [Coxiellaceae bacterium]
MRNPSDPAAITAAMLNVFEPRAAAASSEAPRPRQTTATASGMWHKVSRPPKPDTEVADIEMETIGTARQQGQ